MKRSIGTNNATILLKAMICVLFALSFASMCYGGEEASYKMPSSIDSSAKYLLFLHNYYVEKHGPNGACKYYDILKTFADNGFNVISEIRSGKIVP